ncbi:MAG TPA: hypothetical protein VGH92_06960 [Gaiellaceae bacterium]
MIPGRRHGLALAAVVAVATLVSPIARGDGDPASDVLLGQSVFFPYDAPSQAAQGALEQAVSGVYAHGGRVKVALIPTSTDLGAIPSLFGKPGDYAHFLGVELGLWYVGPLLVVMPAGFGIYDGGRSTAAEENVLRSLHVDASSSDGLARSATTALQRLAAASALDSPDIRAPLVTAYPASARRGKTATLRFDLFDDSGRSSAVVRIYERRRLLAILTSHMQFEIDTRHVNVMWPVPSRLQSRKLRFCVVASDPSGNRSAPACAPFLRVT